VLAAIARSALVFTELGDTANFIVGPFDFPMIDSTRLSGGKRTSVSLTALNQNVLSVALAYFPASRASLKDTPYYDEVMRELRRNGETSSPIAR
jgi:hypothetical protein